MQRGHDAAQADGLLAAYDELLRTGPGCADAAWSSRGPRRALGVTPVYLRGQVVYADLGHGRKPWLVVSNNQRNGSRKGDVVAVRITTTSRAAELPTVVRLSASDHPFVGSVLCDDPYVIGVDEIDAAAGALPPSTIRKYHLGEEVR